MRRISRALAEVASPILPVAALITLLQLVVVRAPVYLFIRFAFGVVLVILGFSLFLLGVRVGLLRAGEHVGANLPARVRVWVLLVVVGVLGTVAGDPASADGRSADDLRHELQAAMSDGAGVLRDERRLGECAQVVEGLRASLPAPEPCDGGVDVAVEEVRNLVEVARVLVAAALARTETRGTHARVDHPSTDPSQAHRLVVGGARSPVQHSTP